MAIEWADYYWSLYNVMPNHKGSGIAISLFNYPLISKLRAQLLRSAIRSVSWLSPSANAAHRPSYYLLEN